MGSFLVYGETLKPYLSQFDVEKLEMASVMGICAGLLGPNSENVEKYKVLKNFRRTQAGPGGAKRMSDRASRTVWEGVEGGLTLPLGAWFGGLEVWRV